MSIKRIFFPLMLLLMGGGLLFTALPTGAADIAVVDTVKILSESKPGKDGEVHLEKVREILQKGMDELQKIYKGKENTADAQNALREGYIALERQMNAERQAVLQVLSASMEVAVKQWRSDNSKYEIVISRQMLLDSAPSVNVTAEVMKEMDKQNPKFPPLPQVTVTQPPADAKKDAPAAAPEKELKKPVAPLKNTKR